MPERSALNQVIQLGVEATPGVTVYAPKRLQSIGFEPSPTVEMDQFRPAGQKYRAITTLGKEWTEAAISGRGSYTELVYALSSVMDTPVITTPSGGTLSRLWTFTPDSTNDDDPQTYTVEHGSAVRADRFNYGIITELGMTFNRQAIEVSGSMMGQSLTDNITLSASRTVADAVTTNADATLTSATAAFVVGDVGKVITGAGIPVGTTILSRTNATTIELSGNATASATGVTIVIGPIQTIPLIPIVPTQVSVFMDTTFSGLGTTKLTRCISAEFTLGSRFAGVWVLDAAQPSFVNHIETEPDLSLTLMLQADTQGMALLDDMRDGDTKFIRIQAIGPVIETGFNHSFTLDIAVKVADTGGFSDQDGVYAIEFSFVGVTDGAWGKALECVIQNALTAL